MGLFVKEIRSDYHQINGSGYQINMTVHQKMGLFIKIDFFKKKRALYWNEKILILKIRKWDNFNANVDVGTGDNTVKVDDS